MSYPFRTSDITMAELIKYIETSANLVEDLRVGDNCKYKNISDFVLSAFSIFFFQDGSFLKNQRRMKEEQGRSNAESLFRLHELPKDSRTREMLDEITPSSLTSVYNSVFSRLEDTKIIDSYKYDKLSDQLLIAIDGVNYFDSETIHCEKCTVKTSHQYYCSLFVVKKAPSTLAETELLLGDRRVGYFITEQNELYFVNKLKKKKWLSNINITDDNLNKLKKNLFDSLDESALKLGIDNHYIKVFDKLSSKQLEVVETYSKHAYYNKHYVHQMITPVLVHPESSHVISLPPEFIENHDGYIKQDCEQNAAKRWFKTHGSKYSKRGVTILCDDLYSNSVFGKYLLSLNYNFIMVCKDGSHKNLYRELEALTKENKIQEHDIETVKNKKKIRVIYRYINGVSISAEKDALKANWIEITEVDIKTGKILFHNAFITNHEIKDNNYIGICIAGRARWKIENENNNELKRHGYNLEHNYGHGKKYLSQNLATLNILSFLFHTVMALTSETYDFIRNKFSSKKEIFDHFRVVAEYFHFNTWEELLLKIAKKSKKEIDKIYAKRLLEPIQ